MSNFMLPPDFEWPNNKNRAARLKSSDAVELQKLEVEKDPNNLVGWDGLFKLYDEKFTEIYTKDPDSIDEAFKKSVYESFSLLLQRFPYLTQYWISWQLFEYKLNGVEKSIDILSKSIQSFPTSIDLWVEYLNALVTQIKHDDPEEKQSQIAFIRLQYHQAIKYNGFNYNAHPLWDKIIEFESSIDATSDVLLNLYLTLIKIPLYQYSQYYKQFGEINKKFDINKVIPQTELQVYVAKFNKTKAEELSMIERHQIIDDYSDKISTVTQQQVLAKWNYESAITTHEFSLSLANNNPDYIKWVEYLDFELDSSEQHKGCIDSIKSVFERALIPNCFNSKLWLKYLTFVSTLEADDKFEIMKSIYIRAMGIIPLSETLIRLSFVKFLFHHDKNEEGFELITGILSELKNNRIYLKKPFLETLQLQLNITFIKLGEELFENLLKVLIERYFDKIEKKVDKPISEEILTNDNEPSVKNYIDFLPRLINNDSICLIIMLYLKSLLASKNDKKGIIIRKFYNKYAYEHALKSSVSFWKFYVEYEGIINYNLANLNNVMSHIKSNTCLPQVVIDSLIDLNYDIVSANLNLSFDAGNQVVDSILKRDNDISKSFTHNENIKKRIVNNLVTKESKILQSNNKEEEILRMIKRHATHPGIFIDTTPDITNKFLNKGNWVSLTDDNLSVPPFPIFKNVEKASLPIPFPTD